MDLDRSVYGEALQTNLLTSPDVMSVVARDYFIAYYNGYGNLSVWCQSFQWTKSSSYDKEEVEYDGQNMAIGWQ